MKSHVSPFAYITRKLRYEDFTLAGFSKPPGFRNTLTLLFLPLIAPSDVRSGARGWVRSQSRKTISYLYTEAGSQMKNNVLLK